MQSGLHGFSSQEKDLWLQKYCSQKALWFNHKTNARWCKQQYTHTVQIVWHHFKKKNSQQKNKINNDLLISADSSFGSFRLWSESDWMIYAEVAQFGCE